MGGGSSPIDPRANSYEFVQHYNLRLDRQPFDWVRYSHMVPMYQDEHPFQVFMAGAQTGKTGRLLAYLARANIAHWGSLFGYYFPDERLPAAFSAQRYAPFLKGSEALRQWVGKDMRDGKGTDRVLARSLGASTTYFLTIEGKTSTEGLPLRGCLFDEVRRMSYHSIQLAEERYSAQTDPIDIKVSTANYPDSDIHLYFLRGDQRWFHTGCGCPEGIVLSRKAEDCILKLANATPMMKRKVEHAFHRDRVPYLGLVGRAIEQYRTTPACYYCPKCGEIITRPRDGWWEPERPGNYAHSWQMPQLLSPTYPASRVIAKIDKPTEPVNIQEVHNSVFGLPYLDATRQPVTLDHLHSCVDKSLPWPANMSHRWRKRNVKNTALGMDAQAGYNCVVIKEMAPNGKHRTIHIEVAHDGEGTSVDPWKRVGKLMYEYDVRYAVIDCLPHWNEAHRFALAFRGRVFLAGYVGGDEQKPMVTWHDTGKKPNQKGEETRFKWSVSIHRTKGLMWSLGRWVKRGNETPDPRTLIQTLPVQGGKVALTSGLRVGEMVPVPICRDVYWVHQTKVAFRDEYEDNEQKKREGKKKIIAEHVGLDPHFAHANLYADVAVARVGRPRL